MPILAQPKPKTRAALKRKVRAACVERDGDCRYERDRGPGECWGPSEWAHFGEKKRFKTMRMNPVERHTLEGSLMLCKGHHTAYDAGELTITATDPVKGANGPLVYGGQR